MKRIAVVIQRYGTEVNGGAEVYARDIAKRLSEFYEVDILTTTALNDASWENFYETGTTQDEKLTVIRFPVDHKKCIYRQFILSKLLFRTPFRSLTLEKKWIAYQGPYSPEAIRYIEEKKDDYDAFIFITYLFYLTAFGLPKVADKSIMIPTAHDERPIWLRYYRELLTKPKAIGFLTEEEKQFVSSIANISQKDVSVIGSGVNTPEHTNSERFRKKYKLTSRYVIYCGRVSTGKGCDNLFSYFEKYKKITESELELVILGKIDLPDPSKEYIHCFGFVSDEDKFDALSGAEALILPSQYESLSLSVLESLSLGIPVLVNGQSEVLKGHCIRSHAGLYYLSEEEFLEKLKVIDDDTSEYQKMRTLAPQYVQKYYSWDRTINELRRMIDQISVNESNK